MVGTGGKNLGKFVTRQPNSRKRVREHGVLRLRLYSKSYQWRFARAGNNACLDGGSASCV
jgi:hypothetical protein